MADEQTAEQIAATEAAAAEAAKAEGKTDQEKADAEKVAADAKAKEEEFVDDNALPEGEVPVVKKEGEEGEEEEEEMLPEDQQNITKAVKKIIAPLETTIHNNRVETELQQIMLQNPEYKPFEARIRRFVTAPNRTDLIKAGLPVRSVVIEAISPYLQQIGATKAKAADAKANLASDGGGTQDRPTAAGKFPDVSKMSNKEIEELGEKVKSGRYTPGK